MPTPFETIVHKTGRTTVVTDYFADKDGNVRQVTATASTEAGPNAASTDKVNRTKHGASTTAMSESKKKRVRVSTARIVYVDFFGRAVTVTTVTGGGGVSITAGPPGSGGGRGRRGGGGGGRPFVRPLPTLTVVNYQLAPELPPLTTAAAVLAARTPSQRRLLANPNQAALFRVHPFGGGLVSIFATVAPNAFVGVGATVLPGGRVSTKVVLEYYCVIAGTLMGNSRATDYAFVHHRARIQDHAVIGDEAWVDQETWVGGKVTVGGTMNIVTDGTGHLQIGGFGNIVGAFDIIGGGKIMTGSHAYSVPRQIDDLVRSATP